MVAMNGSALTISHTGRSGAWRGVLRDMDGNIVAECGHSHPNRDTGSTFRSAATQCMEMLVRKVIFGKIVEQQKKFAVARAKSIRETGRDQYGERKLHPLDQRAIELAPVIGVGPIFRSGRLIAVASDHAYKTWLESTPSDFRSKFQY